MPIPIPNRPVRVNTHLNELNFRPLVKIGGRQVVFTGLPLGELFHESLVGGVTRRDSRRRGGVHGRGVGHDSMLYVGAVTVRRGSALRPIRGAVRISQVLGRESGVDCNMRRVWVSAKRSPRLSPLREMRK